MLGFKSNTKTNDTMKNKITNTECYQICNDAPHKIRQLNKKINDLKKKYSIALSEKQEAEQDLNEAYKTGESENIATAKEIIRDAESTIADCRDQIDKANSELEDTKEQFEQAKKELRKKIKPEVDKTVEELKKVVAQVEEYNEQLAELNKLTSFGTLGNRKALFTANVPKLKLSDGLHSMSRTLERKNEKWTKRTG